MEPSLLDKIKRYGAWLILLLLVAGLTAFVTKDRVSKTLNQSFEKSFAVQVTKTAQAEQSLYETKLLLESSRREAKAAAAFKNRTAVRDKDGNVKLDGKGRAIFDTAEGSSSSSSDEAWNKQISEMTSAWALEKEDLQGSISEKEAKILQLEEKSSKSSLKLWRLGAAWEAEWETPLDLGFGRAYLGGGINLPLGPFIVSPAYKLGIPKDGQPWTSGNLRHLVEVDASF